MRIISLGKRKGGVGASTITILLASTLVKHGNKKVLVLDTDAQRTIVNLQKIDERKGLVSLFDIEYVEPIKVQDYLKEHGEAYDIIFIDLPRITSDSDNILIRLLYLCDSILLPVVPSQLSVLSTLPFLDVITDVIEERKKFEFDTTLHGCLSLANRRSYTEDTKVFFEERGLSMFENTIYNLKIFGRLSTAASPLDSKEGKLRFEGFYNEFVTKYNI